MFEINYTFWGDRPLTASSDKDVPSIINKLQDPNTRVLNINCLNLSEVACKQIADALKISHFLIKLSLFAQDFLTKKLPLNNKKAYLKL